MMRESAWMAFKRSAVRSRLSPPKTRTHVADKRYMSPCSIHSRKKSGYLIWNDRGKNERAGLLVDQTIAHRLFFCFRKEERRWATMRIGLIAVDGRGGFPNLALMRLSDWHKHRDLLIGFHPGQARPFLLILGTSKCPAIVCLVGYFCNNNVKFFYISYWLTP